jgi:hypothetical protein
MFRVFVFVVAIVGIFAGTLAYGGMRLGAWDPADPLPPSGQAPLTRPDDDQTKKKRRSEVAGKQTSSEPKLSPAKRRWLRDANALCRRAARESGRLKRPRDLDAAEAVIEKLARLNARYNDEFAALRPARADRAEVRRLLALFEKDEALIDEFLSALRNGQAPRSFLEILNRLERTAEQENALLLYLGATDCAAGFAVSSISAY